MINDPTKSHLFLVSLVLLLLFLVEAGSRLYLLRGSGFSKDQARDSFR